MESTTGMTRESVIILRVAVGALVCGGWFAYWFIKDGLPAWSVWMVLGFVAFFAVLIASSFLPGEEEKLARQLEGNSQAGRASAKIVTMRRLSSQETTTLRKTELGLKLLLSESDGRERAAELDVWVEDALLPNFGTGKTVHVMYDPDAPSKVAIDRRQTPIQVQ
jgi:hypothetical protein